MQPIPEGFSTVTPNLVVDGGAAAIDFYERLQADNTKTFWQANKDTYEAAVKRPMDELCAELADYGQFHVFRPYNDLRFAKNRPPYKTAQAAATQGEGGTGYYVQISAEGLMAAAGYYMMAKDQLERYRAAVDDESSGTRAAELVDALDLGWWQLRRRHIDLGRW